MAFTNPLFIAVGGLVKIPVGGVVDYLLHGDTYNSITITGFSVTFLGVLLMNFYTFRELILERKKNRELQDVSEAETKHLVN